MKKTIWFIFLSGMILSAAETKKDILNKQLQKAMEDEKKYAKEQMFYDQYSYDFKGSEVNPKSLKYIKDVEVDDLDMDNVYD